MYILWGPLELVHMLLKYHLHDALTLVLFAYQTLPICLKSPGGIHENSFTDEVLTNSTFVDLSILHQNYLSSKGKTWRDLRREALQSLQQGTYSLTGELLNPNMQQFSY